VVSCGELRGCRLRDLVVVARGGENIWPDFDYSAVDDRRCSMMT
jgi:hypothetical protein